MVLAAMVDITDYIHAQRRAYDPHPICPKCLYTGGGMQAVYRTVSRTLHGREPRDSTTVEDEYLACGCPKCGYHWEMWCADATVTTTGSSEAEG